MCNRLVHAICNPTVFSRSKNCARMRTDVSIATDKTFTGGTNLIRL